MPAPIDPLMSEQECPFCGVPPERVMMSDELAIAIADAPDLPDGFTVGVNDGAAAGQTVPHLHLHVIPRRTGDCPDPRGGLRRIFPDKAEWWKSQ